MERKPKFLLINSDGVKITINKYGEVFIGEKDVEKKLSSLILDALTDGADFADSYDIGMRAEIRIVIREIKDKDVLIVTPDNVAEVAEKISKGEAENDCKIKRDSSRIGNIGGVEGRE
jgi:hypothetical protein